MVELAWEVARHLPYLRRYARAILASKSGRSSAALSALDNLIRE